MTSIDFICEAKGFFVVPETSSYAMIPCSMLPRGSYKVSPKYLYREPKF